MKVEFLLIIFFLPLSIFGRDISPSISKDRLSLKNKTNYTYEVIVKKNNKEICTELIPPNETFTCKSRFTPSRLKNYDVFYNYNIDCFYKDMDTIKKEINKRENERKTIIIYNSIFSGAETLLQTNARLTYNIADFVHTSIYGEKLEDIEKKFNEVLKTKGKSTFVKEFYKDVPNSGIAKAMTATFLGLFDLLEKSTYPDLDKKIEKCYKKLNENHEKTYNLGVYFEDYQFPKHHSNVTFEMTNILSTRNFFNIDTNTFEKDKFSKSPLRLKNLPISFKLIIDPTIGIYEAAEGQINNYWYFLFYFPLSYTQSRVYVMESNNTQAGNNEIRFNTLGGGLGIKGGFFRYKKFAYNFFGELSYLQTTLFKLNEIDKTPSYSISYGISFIFKFGNIRLTHELLKIFDSTFSSNIFMQRNSMQSNSFGISYGIPLYYKWNY